MLYHVDFHIEYPASMAQKDFLRIAPRVSPRRADEQLTAASNGSRRSDATRRHHGAALRDVGLSVNGVIAVAALLSAAEVPRPAVSADGSPVKLAVFDFELDDLTPAAAYLSKAISAAATLGKVTHDAREELAQSGRYQLVDISQANATAAATHTLRNCEGCEAAIALKLGAQQSLLGIVRRVTQTDYYVAVLIRDAHTGKLVNEQEANFAGDETGWPTGVRMLIKHQVLVAPEPHSSVAKPR